MPNDITGKLKQVICIFYATQVRGFFFFHLSLKVPHSLRLPLIPDLIAACACKSYSTQPIMHSRRPDFLMTGCAPSLSGHGCGLEPHTNTRRNTHAHTHTHTHTHKHTHTHTPRVDQSHISALYVSVPSCTEELNMFSTCPLKVNSLQQPGHPSFSSTFSLVYH